MSNEILLVATSFKRLECRLDFIDIVCSEYATHESNNIEMIVFLSQNNSQKCHFEEICFQGIIYQETI